MFECDPINKYMAMPDLTESLNVVPSETCVGNAPDPPRDTETLGE